MEHKTLLRSHAWNGCSFTYSSFHELSARAGQPAGTCGIKYVIDGTEHYGLHGRNYFVRAGHYLLVNENRRFDIELTHSRTPVRGFCITLPNDWMLDAERCYTQSAEQLLDLPAGHHMAATDLPEMIHPAGDAVSDLLVALTARLDTQTGRVAGNDELLFAAIAEATIVAQRKLRRITAPLAARRNSTRIELYRRIAYAKAIMDDAPETVQSIGALAEQAALSEFHFMRSFRQLFGISPHQYLVQRRMHKAQELLADHFSVSEAALRCGFADLPSFSKAFRKHFGCAPSRFSRI